MVMAKAFRSKLQKNSALTKAALSVGLFFLALFPRAYDLSRFVTADEAKWVYRSAHFLAAFLQGDFAATTVNLTPAVTTTWLGSLGLLFYYQLNQTEIGLSLTDWLLSLPQFRTDLDILVAARWPIVVCTSLAVVAIYWLAGRLFNPALALLAAAFIALDPHTIALSRILGHDAPVTVFVTLSLLSLLLALVQAGGQGSRGAEGRIPPLPRPSAPLLLITLSGLMAGLAFLSKAPALFLIPFTGLIFLTKVWADRPALFFWAGRFVIWGAIAYLTFVVVWPAAWVDPVGRPLAVVENAFLSATDQVEAGAEGFWLVPDLGPFYYIVNGGFKISPLVMIGAGLAIIFFAKKQSSNSPNSPTPQLPSSPASTFWLLAFVLLFTVFMTLGGKRSSRYILPVFPALAVVAAIGWLGLYQRSLHLTNKASLQTRPLRVTFYILLIFIALIIQLPYAPYYFTYFNPLLGGSYTAPHMVKIGWGEGLDRVGRFLQRELSGSRVGTAYSSTVAPFFKGDLAGLDSDRLDYVVLYRKQIQAGNAPLLPGVVRYYQQDGSLFSVDLNGIRYADVYRGPAVQPVLAFASENDAQTKATGFRPKATGFRPSPIGFRPATAYGHIGQALPIDVLWAVESLGENPLSPDPMMVTLASLQEPSIVLAGGEGRLDRRTDELIISQHQLSIPSDVTRGVYLLQVDGHPLGQIDLRNFQTPSGMAEVFAVFGGQIGLQAYKFSPTDDYIEINLAWQAKLTHLPDYTVFVQMLDTETDARLAGIDTQPEGGAWPTSRWAQDEVVLDTYYVAVPPDLKPGHLKIIVGLYQPESGQRLLLQDGSDHWVLPWTLIRERD